MYVWGTELQLYASKHMDGCTHNYHSNKSTSTNMQDVVLTIIVTQHPNTLISKTPNVHVESHVPRVHNKREKRISNMHVACVECVQRVTHLECNNNYWRMLYAHSPWTDIWICSPWSVLRTILTFQVHDSPHTFNAGYSCVRYSLLSFIISPCMYMYLL